MTKPVVIVLAAGEGTRMKSATPKVLHRVAGRTLLGHAVRAAQQVDPERIAVVVRHGRDQVADEARQLDPAALIADQDEIPGTGRAVQCALAALDVEADPADASPVAAAAVAPAAAREAATAREPAASTAQPPGAATAQPPAVPTTRPGQILVIPGDTPRLDGAALADLLKSHLAQSNAITILTAELDEPHGYGRVIRDETGQVAKIVEERDATDQERQVKEINSSVYVFEAELLRAALAELGRANAQGEVYLTDVVAAARRQGASVRARVSPDASITEGVNNRAQLAAAAQQINARRLAQAMADGVTVQDPATTWIDLDVELENDVILLQGTHLAGRTKVARGAVVGPFTTLTDTEVGPGATVDRTVAKGAVIGAGAVVGPFTHLRPGTRLGQEVKAGSFTELKAAEVADRAKVPHLAYVGDASIAEAANVGAGTIFANYDGVSKSRCEIGPAVRIGSNNVIVAPVSMGAGAYSGAGTIVRGDVPPGALAVSAPPQRLIEGWTQRKRPGTDSALAAEAALAQAEHSPVDDAVQAPSSQAFPGQAVADRFAASPAVTDG
ncbi:MAG: bifunctional UDP-N-acetylglucosamine diphosphorylase/glucosamine-1-phosphate N-acetyltransferase GlmU, partial [Bifidobacteriaceae bacterium]|nr:bifunctional UDP-N-acetylglucosamine diphosphorylase/glucosamine-1-phosphate N-acetyltransferase GlmU [Bifidobacteriaceae bacterium]